MKQVQTVLGPISVEQLGVSLMHEHLVIGWPGWVFDPLARFDRMKVTAMLIERLLELKTLGVSTFVDPCPIELGRNPELAAEVAEATGVHIICATGLYTNRLGIPVYFRQRSVDEIADIFKRELTEGIGSSGIRAGLIKCATGLNEITRHEEKCLRAAGRAHKATGAPILTHTESATMGNEQLDILASEGVDFTRVIIGHSCGTADLRRPLARAPSGAHARAATRVRQAELYPFIQGCAPEVAGCRCERSAGPDDDGRQSAAIFRGGLLARIGGGSTRASVGIRGEPYPPVSFGNGWECRQDPLGDEVVGRLIV
jgi:hypothetical protein